MKQRLHILWILFAVLCGLTACSDKDIAENKENVLPNGDVVLSINTAISETKVVVSRDIDPDGLGLKTLHLLCFDNFGLYIGQREASDITLLSNDDQGQASYSIKVAVPGDTRRIHFLSNVSMEEVNAVPGMSETTLMPSIVTASGLMAYWGRVQFATNDELINFSKKGNVTLYRNQAQVCYQEVGDAAGQNLQVFGYAICNRRAWGTAAPFNTKAENGHQFDFDLESPYVTEPAEQYKALASDPTQVTQRGDATKGDSRYIFETPNTLNAPVYAIMYIGTTRQDAKYYKIMFVDANKNQLPIWRNYKYVIRIKNLPTQMGYATYDEAKKGVAANNAWVSVDPEIPEISDGMNTLKVMDGTTRIFNKGGIQTISFTYTGNQEDIAVSWLDNDGSISSASPRLSAQGSNKYLITIDLTTPGKEPKIGTLLLRAGVFTRQIKIYLMQPFEFKPVWVSTGVPMKKGERLSMTFVIPDNYPRELFPITCKIGTNKMNANNDLGVQLSIISEDCAYNIENEEGEEPDRVTNWGYKFEYIATRPGIQEVFFTLNVSEGNDPTGTVTYPGNKECPYASEKTNHTHVFLEADGFKDEEKVVLFQGGNVEKRITIDGAEQNNPGFLLKSLPPIVNQPVAITLNFSGAIPTATTVMCIATTSLEPIEEEKSKYENGGKLTTNGIVNYYWIKPGTNREITLNFRTNTADVNDLVRFSIDNDNESGYNPSADNWFKSVAVELRATPERYKFNFSIVDDTPEADNVKYGLNQPADMHFSIPEEVVQATDLTLYIQTNNLKPNPEGPNAQWLKPTEGGYLLNIPKGTPADQRGTIKFLTSRIANAETVTIRTVNDSQALFEPASASFTNLPISGILKLEGADAPQLDNDSFITLERKNGTRVGDFNITRVDESGTASYKLTVRPEYDFTMDEELTVAYHSLSDNQKNSYRAHTTFSTLVAHEVGEEVPLIILTKE